MDTLSTLLEDVHLHETKYYRLKLGGQWAYSLTRQDVLLFYLVESGSLTIEMNGVCRQVDAGQMMMLPNAYHHICHRTGCSKDNPICIDDMLDNASEEFVIINADRQPNTEVILIECQYDKEVTRPLLASLPTILPQEKYADKSRYTILEIGCQYLTLESNQRQIGKTAIINHLASILLIECLRNFIEALPEATDSWLMAIKDPYLAKALAVMHADPQENWTIHKLAEVAGMSRSSFAERFKEVVGVPPLTYLIDYRLRLAARYLCLQQNSISRISELVGYASDSTFSQAFKRVYGMSPRAYRQQYQASQIA